MGRAITKKKDKNVHGLLLNSVCVYCLYHFLGREARCGTVIQATPTNTDPCMKAD